MPDPQPGDTLPCESKRAWLQRQAALSVPGALVALALTLPAYRYRLLWHHGTEDIYFELRDWFIYLNDIPLLIALGAWLLTPFSHRIGRLPRWLVVVLALLALLASLSALWSPMRSLAFYQAARLWLLFGLFLVVATAWEARGALIWGLAVSGALQAGLGLAQFLAQHTFGLKDLGELMLRPEWPGASVVTVEGVRILRAYGLTQHPNLLAGVLVMGTLLGVGLALSAQGRRQWVAVALAGANFGGLLITFSRAAWLGLAVAGVGLLLLLARRPFREQIDWRVGTVTAAMLAGVGLVFVGTQWPLLLPRLGLSWEGVEVRSNDERAGLEASSWTLIREHPLLGVGYGNFAVALWLRRPSALEAYPIYQPVHRAPLLAAAELGIPGVLMWLSLAAGPWTCLWRQRQRWPARGVAPGLAVSLAAVLLALTVISWFDFYPWFSQQGRLLSWIGWGLWAQTAVRADG